MQKFIPFAKLSKKSQQVINKSKRKKAQVWKDVFPRLSFFIACFSFKTKFIYIVV